MNQNRLPRRQAVSDARKARMLSDAWGRDTTTNFMDDWEKSWFEPKRAKPVFLVALGIWVLSILASLAIMGLLIWGGIEAILWLREQ